jgi:hypothetical protein
MPAILQTLMVGVMAWADDPATKKRQPSGSRVL